MRHSQILVIACVTWACTASGATTVYVYEDANGTRIISDSAQQDPALTLIKKYTPQSVAQSLRPVSHEVLNRRAPSPRVSLYDQTIFQIADQFKLDRALIKSIIHIESAFNPLALSNKGAQGLMQLMPKTAISYDVSDPFDVAENILGGARYIKHLLSRYDGDIRLALAAYNAGETAVNKFQGIPPYPETQRYVKLVLDLHKDYQNHAVAIYG